MDFKPINELKLEYNNEVIKIKQYILQAKTQTINKLAKKIKAFKARKGTDEQKEKYKRKADSFVSEIMIIKQIQRNDLAKFAMTNLENVDKIINNPLPSKERAMARLISHKSLKKRFEDIKNKYSNIPTARLLEQDPKKIRRKKRKEHLKAKMKTAGDNIKTEEKLTVSRDEEADEKIDNLKNKKKNKRNLKQAISTDSFSVESVVPEIVDELENDEISQSNNAAEANDSSEKSDTDNSSECDDPPLSENNHFNNSSLKRPKNNDSEASHKIIEKPSKKLAIDTDEFPLNFFNNSSLKRTKTTNPEANHKANERPSKKMAIDSDELPLNSAHKIVDTFFVTNGGSNYMTLALPRPADVVEDGKDSGRNRKMRRAALFGNKIKLREEKRRNQKPRNEKPNIDNRNFNQNPKQERSFVKNEKQKSNETIPSKNEEKLHPSWQAKKQQSSILPFKGNKITFD